MPKKVLVIDDSATIRSMISNSIEEIGDFETLEASNGFEALKMLPATLFDLIITDINMPEINGLEIVNFVRNHPVYQKIPLIIVTTEQGEEDRKKGIELGATEYVTKPFDPEELKKIVLKVMEEPLS
ncbi:MAG TPA: response regulator [Nitrospiria bacterium]|jgi:two-component system chemotaxis response regulator CheY